MNNYPPYFTFLYDADFGTTTGVILSTETTPDDIRHIVEDIREEKPDEWTWDDIWMSLPSDCYVCDREWHNTVQIQRGEGMAKLFIRLIGAMIGSAPYVAALWMLLNGYGY